MNEVQQILASIRSYAGAYAEFQRLQDAHPRLLPLGDQKTGVIGEFYAMLFAQNFYPQSRVSFADPTAAWDLEVSADTGGPDLRIQVKTASAYSRTRIITPIFPGWDYLYLLYVETTFAPLGFWIVTNPNIFGTREALRNQKMRLPTNPNSGSPAIPFGHNRVAELVALLPHEPTP
jgi:hypothetical protein